MNVRSTHLYKTSQGLTKLNLRQRLVTLLVIKLLTYLRYGF
jgi:hypothetical protein